MLVAPIRGPKGMLLNMVTDAEPSQPAPTLEALMSLMLSVQQEVSLPSLELHAHSCSNPS
jgi:hypothetical protein